MKGKKLLILLASIAVVIVFIVIMIAVFSVKSVNLVYHNFDGSNAAIPNDALPADDILSMCKGKSVVFLSKSKLLSQINQAHPQWHAFAVIKNFPNALEIHLVRPQAIIQLDVGGDMLYLDSFGFVTAAPAEGAVIDITSAFDNRDAAVKTPGQKFEFVLAENNQRLECIINAVLATWQCKVDVADLSQILGKENVFTYNADGDLLIHPSLGGTIRIVSPETDLADRLIKAYGVYYNTTLNLQSDEWTITVHKNGRITTSSAK